jgi:hypothetical protein
MLAETDIIALDRREVQHAIAQELERIQSRPVEDSVVRDGRDFAKVKLESLRRLLEIATPEERVRIEEEIARYQARQTRCDAELAAREQTSLNRQDPPTAMKRPDRNSTNQPAAEDGTSREPEAINPNALSSAPVGPSVPFSSSRSNVGQARSTVDGSHGEATRRRASREVKRHRLRILKTLVQKRELTGMEALALRLQISVTALYGMVREDRTRYSDDKLDSVLEQIRCTRAEWDFVDRPSPTA